MKKILSAMICIGLLGATACSKETTITKSADGDSTPTETSSPQDSDSSDVNVAAINDIEVDENLLSVTITMPADLVGETTQEELDQMVTETEGFFSATLNDDGSVTYVMTKAKHQEWIDSTAEGFDNKFQEIVDSDDYKHVVSITHNDSFSEFTVGYDEDEIKGFDSFLCLSFYTCGSMYGVVTGEKPENIYITFVNSETGEVIFESNYLAYVENLERMSEETSSSEE